MELVPSSSPHHHHHYYHHHYYHHRVIVSALNRLYGKDTSWGLLPIAEEAVGPDMARAAANYTTITTPPGANTSPGQLKMRCNRLRDHGALPYFIKQVGGGGGSSRGLVVVRGVVGGVVRGGGEESSWFALMALLLLVLLLMVEE